MTQTKWFKTTILVIFIAVALTTVYYSFTLTKFFTRNTTILGNETGGFETSIESEVPTPEGIAPPIADATPAADEDTGFDYSIFGEWEGSERVNILVMGLDLRDWEAGEGAPRTDTMIVFTIDPLSKTAGMLSIPRDLWVPIPGFQYDRINTAYRNGETYDYPGGGPALAAKTVEQLLGIPIHYYAQVDFNVFVTLVDEIGGVKIDVPEEILVDLIGPEPPKTISPGRQTFSGEIALAYARARNSEGGDFDRAQRQQLVILGLRENILTWDRMPYLISRSAVLYSELNDGIRTNMSLEEAIQLMLLVLEIPLEDIARGAIGSQDALQYLTLEGDQVLKPIPDRIHAIRNIVFGTTAQSSPLANMTQQERIAAENANILFLNGTFEEGLSARTIAYFNSLGGFSIPAENIGGADQNYIFTTVIDYTGNPYTLEFLIKEMKIQSNRIIFEYDPNSEVDIVIYLGSDWTSNIPDN